MTERPADATGDLGIRPADRLKRIPTTTSSMSSYVKL